MTDENGPRDWPEPQPTDGPEYHADHAFWREAMTDAPRCKATTASGTPCQKRLYRSSDGEFWPHAGGHWFMADDVHACLSDDHYDPVSVLTHGPLVHLDVPCTRVIPPGGSSNE